ncbi:unnamed protein product [Amoebophrya sp. A120]|nr:unnamed protein product [Amoebophrya sp. A120]|eukprot:GSA120T00017519001.1
MATAQYVVGQIAVNTALALYLTYFLPQIIYNQWAISFPPPGQKSTTVKQISLLTQLLQFLTSCVDLVYGLAGVPQWQYWLVSAVSLLCLSIQEIQILHVRLRIQQGGRSDVDPETGTLPLTRTRGEEQGLLQESQPQAADEQFLQLNDGAPSDKKEGRTSGRVSYTDAGGRNVESVPVCLVVSHGVTTALMLCGSLIVTIGRFQISTAGVDSLGFIETALYLLTWLPQVYWNWRNKNGDAYSAVFLAMQWLACVCDLVTAFCVSDYPLPSKITPWFLLAIVSVHLGQKHYYRGRRHREQNEVTRASGAHCSFSVS